MTGGEIPLSRHRANSYLSLLELVNDECQGRLGRLDVDVNSHLVQPTPVRLINFIMPRQFFVGGNFKMNPNTRDQKAALVGILNNAQLDPSTGKIDSWQL